MANITQDNTTFNVSSEAVFAKNGKYSHGSNTYIDDNKITRFDVDYFAENPDEISKSFNAIEIDWNNAQLGNKVDSATLTPGEEIIIQTTGQLLSYMSTIAQKLTNLENILINL